jgi:ABC-type bacteriocin/lantibiotic exporter with double-glycine peptidase domain
MRESIFRLLPVLLCASVLVCAAAEPAGLWLDVPFVKQEKNGCGAASIAMVMQFWQRQQGQSIDASSDPTHIQLSLYSPQAHGIYASDIEHYFQQRGFRTFAFQGTADDLQHHLEKGRPLIVALKPVALKPGRRTPLHYVVVAGLDPDHNLVLLNDPGERKLLRQELASFAKQWKDAGNWTLLAVPQSEGASSAR